MKTLIGKLPPNIANDGAVALWGAAQEHAREYALRVDRGVAYTFAVAVELGVPAMSNDGSSLRVMKQNYLDLPQPVFRSFDLYALAVQSGAMPVADANKVLGHLKTGGEHVPRAFEHRKFEDGLTLFDARLLDESQPAVGTHTSPTRLAPVAAVSVDPPENQPKNSAHVDSEGTETGG